MIVNRDEFHLRYWGNFKIEKEVAQTMNVSMLMKEIKADAKYRNHTYLFDGTDLTTLPIQEDTTGIKKKCPDIKTEQDRLGFEEFIGKGGKWFMKHKDTKQRGL